MRQSLDDAPVQRCALVTGGSRGIGRAVVRALSAQGWSVVSLDRQSPERLERNEQFHKIDLADRATLGLLLGRIAAECCFTGLVNNVGVGLSAPLEETRVEQLELMNQINLWCPVQCLQAILPKMRERGFGRVVNVASRAALGKPGRTIYSATKAGLHGMTRTWALEFAREGITVNTVSPGPIATEMFDALNPPGSASTAAIVEAVPVRRMGTAEDVAHAVAFFMDDRAGFTTGQLLHVCGGLTVGVAC